VNEALPVEPNAQVLTGASVFTRDLERKGQYYAINLVDTQKKDTTINTAVRVRFHDQQQLLEKTENWRTWLSQQPSRAARPIEIDKIASVGIRSVDASEFDTVRFQWSGQRGAKALVRLNCLSTEFSRSKGVKGIHLRCAASAAALFVWQRAGAHQGDHRQVSRFYSQDPSGER